MSEKSKYFISYSRQQLYFAESLAINLQANNFDVWFDLQQIEPGSNWQAEIAEGLTTADQLIFIASSESIASPYVAEEWQAALSAKKPVTIVLFEPVNLPEALRHCAVVDFRWRFDKALQKLFSHLHGDVPSQTKPPRVLPFGLRLLVPLDILLICLMLWISVISMVGLTWYIFAEIVPLVGLLMGGITVWVAYIALQFYRNLADYRALRLAITPAIAYGLFLPLLVLILLIGVEAGIALYESTPVPTQTLVPAMSIGIPFILVFGYIYIYVLNFSPDLARWFPAGKLTQNMRLRINQRVIRRIKNENGIFYHLHYTPLDSPTAQSIRRIFAKNWLLEETESETARYHLLILSNYTPLEMVKSLMEQYPLRVICILASSIQIPDEVRDIMRYQWVDYIGRDPETITQLGYSLQNPDSARIGYAMVTVPQKLENIRTPSRINFVLLNIRSAGGLWFGAGLMGLFVTFNNEKNPLQNNILLLILGLLALWVGVAIVERRLPLFWVMAIYLAILAIVFVFNPLPEAAGGTGIYEVQPGDNLSSIASEQCGSPLRWREIANANDMGNHTDIVIGQELTIDCTYQKYQFDLVSIIFPLGFFVVALPQLRRWLPGQVVWKRSIFGFHRQSRLRLLLVSLLWLIAGSITSLYIYADL